MASPYPLPPGCIFREDFKSPALAAQNGLVITGNPWMAGGARTSAGNTILGNYDLNNVALLSSFTIIVDVDLAQFTGTERGLWCVVADGAYSTILLSALAGENRLNVGSSSTGNVALGTFVPGRRILALSCTGSSVAMYIDGALSATASLTRYKRTYYNFVVGMVRSVGTNTFGGLFRSLRAYNYAMTAEEIAADYRKIRGNQA